MQRNIPWYQPLKVRLRQVTCGPFRADRYESEIALYAIQSYGFLVKFGGEGKSFTFADLADRIKQSYDCTDTPMNAEVVRVLLALHLRNPHEPQPMLAYGFRDMNGNEWCKQWIDAYNRFTEAINLAGSGIAGSMAEHEREFYLDQRHKQYLQFADLARKAA